MIQEELLSFISYLEKEELYKDKEELYKEELLSYISYSEQDK